MLFINKILRAITFDMGLLKTILIVLSAFLILALLIGVLIGVWQVLISVFISTIICLLVLIFAYWDSSE